jgi:SPP1 gp7 family putative phage head morphogenesis protein
MSINDDIRDLQLRHTVGLQRLSSSVVKKILKILDEVDADILKKLAARGPTLSGTIASQRLKSLLDAVRQIAKDGYVQVGMDLRQELRDLAKYEVQFQKEMLEGKTPVRLDITTPSAQILNTIVTNHPLQGALLNHWVQDLSRKKVQLVSNAIRLGMVQGETTDQIIRRIRGTQANSFRDGVLNIPRNSAEKLVRTAVNQVSTQARDQLYQENDDIVKGWQWVATLDTRTCIECADRDGQVFDVGEDGEKPPLHINCRCTTTPVLKSWRELGVNLKEAPDGTRASMNGQISETDNYASWLEKQSAAVQDEALGKTRGALFRRGELSFDRFTDQRGNQLTLDQLREREAKAFNLANLEE